jgi:menaquinone-specific isochorismate synthase
MNNFIKHIKDSLTDFVNSNIEKSKSKDGLFFCFAEKIDASGITKTLHSEIFKEKNYFYFGKPEDKFEWLAVDQLITLNQPNDNPFDFIQNNFAALKNKFLFNRTASEIISIPFIQCQLKFKKGNVNESWNSFPDFKVTIPKILLLNENDQMYLIFIFFSVSDIDFDFVEKLFSSLKNVSVDNGYEKVKILNTNNSESTEDRIEWNKLIESGKQKLVNGELKKIVLSREKEFLLSDSPNFSLVIENLKSRFPNCFIFLTKSGDHSFFGASPESFIKSNNDELVFEAVAGTVPRGNHIDEEISFEKRLKLDPKLKLEHEIVRDYIFNKIHELSSPIKISETSFVRKLDNIQHLVTKISIPLKNKTELFKYINELYPTPAVCGFPKDAALEMIIELELHERGLYSGLLGWFDLDLNGELVVGIRSALSHKNKIIAFAGGGILPDSNAEEEFLETELKLKPILSLFKNEEKN